MSPPVSRSRLYKQKHAVNKAEVSSTTGINRKKQTNLTGEAICLLTVSSDLSYSSGRGNQTSLQQGLITAENLRHLDPTGLPKFGGKKTSAVITSSANGGEGRDLVEYGMTYNLLTLNLSYLKLQFCGLHTFTEKVPLQSDLKSMFYSVPRPAYCDCFAASTT